MPSKARRLERKVAKLPSRPKELVEQFPTGPMTREAVSAAGLAFKQALIEASLHAGLTHHVGYPPGGERRRDDAFASNVLPIVRQIQAAGVTSTRDIAAALNARGIRTARGGEWHHSTVRSLLARG